MTNVEQISGFSMDFFSLKGKVAIVTGANQGLGMGYALAFARAAFLLSCAWIALSI